MDGGLSISGSGTQQDISYPAGTYTTGPTKYLNLKAGDILTLAGNGSWLSAYMFANCELL